ncbi:MucR family transcriptional regulator [Aestuariivirga sp.]|uniref:MucR family transcriptional regulator n=1 Tax=Aestuariivirga sp. TaxID=2650926 RepID=UPI0039E679A4
MDSSVMTLTAQIVASYLSRNDIPRSELPLLMSDVHQALLVVQSGGIARSSPDLTPRKSEIKRSIFPEYIVCLEDGKRFKSLRRHLRDKFGLTPEQYRLKWGLPSDYPMTAPRFSELRSSLAKSMGLGVTGKRKR